VVRNLWITCDQYCFLQFLTLSSKHKQLNQAAKGAFAMLSKLKKSDSKGFTIIEVMIVLAIAGLIILIVLLAVPALQRNGRNTAIKNDASAVAGAVSEFKANNDGKPPLNVSGTAPDLTLTITGGTGVAPASFKVQTGTTVTAQGVGAAPAVYTAGQENIVYVVPKARCKDGGTIYSATGDLDVSAGAARSTAIIYPVEQRTGAPIGRCIDA
jgi:prepilin-type N-terminal cleavage/methylation domain-containing protein